MSNWLKALFMGYFAGQVISRLGSIIIEPWFNKWKIVKYAPYSDFLKAEKVDEKIPELLADNNMYRTFVAVFMLIVLLEIAHLIPAVDEFMHSEWIVLVLLVGLLLLYIFSFRKQTGYIRKRVEKVVSK